MEEGNIIIHYRKIFRKQVVCYWENTSIVSETGNECHKSISENIMHMHKSHNDITITDAIAKRKSLNT